MARRMEPPWGLMRRIRVPKSLAAFDYATARGSQLGRPLALQSGTV